MMDGMRRGLPFPANRATPHDAPDRSQDRPCYGRENITVSRMPYKNILLGEGKSKNAENGL